MNFLRIFGTAVVASSIVASSAAAVTVTFTHTATVGEVHDPASPLTLAPIVSQSIKAGDTMTLTYSLDSNAIKDPLRSYAEASAYTLQNAQISFSSGYSANLLESYLISWTAADFYVPGNFSLNYELRGADIYGGSTSGHSAYLASARTSRAGTPYAGTVSELAANLNQLPVEYGKFSVDPVLIGLTRNDCYSDYCFIGFTNWNSSVSQGGTKPSLPLVSAVPVPAPFLMLAMAMVGLFGFGRRARA